MSSTGLLTKNQKLEVNSQKQMIMVGHKAQGEETIQEQTEAIFITPSVGFSEMRHT